MESFSDSITSLSIKPDRYRTLNNLELIITSSPTSTNSSIMNHDSDCRCPFAYIIDSITSSRTSSNSNLLDPVIQNHSTDIQGMWQILRTSLTEVLELGAYYPVMGFTVIPPTIDFLKKHNQFSIEDQLLLTKNVRLLLSFRSNTLWIRALAWSSLSQDDIITWLRIVDPGYPVNRERFLTNQHQMQCDEHLTRTRYCEHIDIVRYKIPEKFITNFNKFIKDPTRDLLVTPTNWRDYLEPSIFIIKEPHTRKSSCCSIL